MTTPTPDIFTGWRISVCFNENLNQWEVQFQNKLGGWIVPCPWEAQAYSVARDIRQSIALELISATDNDLLLREACGAGNAWFARHHDEVVESTK